MDVPEVPAVEAMAARTPHEPLLIEVTAGDEVFVDGNKADNDAHLARLLRDSARTAGLEVPVQLSGDKDARNGTMMRVVSQLSQAGFRRIEFAVERGG